MRIDENFRSSRPRIPKLKAKSEVTRKAHARSEKTYPWRQSEVTEDSTVLLSLAHMRKVYSELQFAVTSVKTRLRTMHILMCIPRSLLFIMCTRIFTNICKRGLRDSRASTVSISRVSTALKLLKSYCVATVFLKPASTYLLV